MAEAGTTQAYTQTTMAGITIAARRSKTILRWFGITRIIVISLTHRILNSSSTMLTLMLGFLANTTGKGGPLIKEVINAFG